MFTGLVEQVGSVAQLEKQASGMVRLSVRPSKGLSCEYGDSVAVNGCCLTVAGLQDGCLLFDVSSETLAKTNLGRLACDDVVNLERALLPTTRLGGHFVSGHVDCVARLVTKEEHGDGWLVQVVIPGDMRHYIVTKGSVCLDGVSLTVNKILDEAIDCKISLMLLPTTLAKTTLASRQLGWEFNLEVDVLAKYLERLGTKLVDNLST